MKNLKYMSLMLALVCVFSMGFTSCSDDDDEDINETAAPAIELDEANIEGNELCVEADIKAPGRTASIVIAITNAAGTNTKLTHAVTGSKYIGVLNIDEFHVHVDIEGKNVVAGDLLLLTVTDANGKTATARKSVTEEADDDHDHDHHD